MKMLMMLSLRNLLRQKRRNLMLGIAIGIGVMILIMAGSFSRGISDTLFNRIVTYVAGHVSININEGFGKRTPVFRDRGRLLEIIKKNIGKYDEVTEAVGVFTRAIGNGKADNMVLIGVDTSMKLTAEQRKRYDESFNVIDGKFRDLGTSDKHNPVILSKERADALNVKKDDIVSIRFRNVFGQNQSERCTVIGILSSDNIFMQGVMFCEQKYVKAMMGYRNYECANIHIKIKNPKDNAVKLADKIHASLTPGPAFIAGRAVSGGRYSEVTVLPFRGDDDSLQLIGSSFKLSEGKMDDVLSRHGVMISSKLASALGIAPGRDVTINYNAKFGDDEASFKVKVKGVFIPSTATGDKTIYIHEALFYPKFYDRIPDLQKAKSDASLPTDSAMFKPALGKEWELLNRTRNSDEMRKKWAAQAGKKIRAATIDVNSMYESASDVLKLESVLNIITISSVLVLFFIILIGVVNTLRMTIKERTREIGTIRAIGMQKKDVQSIFIIETTLLSFFASVGGTVLAFIAMGLLTFMKFNVTDNPMGILLVNRHLHFLPGFGNVVFNIVLILVITMMTAYFPSKRAANLSAAEALRHYE
jgi:ABC-type lipoprotein release transport system permease subunit